LEAVIRLGQHGHELRGLDDLSDEADSVQADVERAEGDRKAAQRRVVLVTERPGFFLRPRLIEAGKRRRPRTWGGRRRRARRWGRRPASKSPSRWSAV